MLELNRREFVAAAAVAACACAVGTNAALGQDQPQPHGHKPPATEPGPTDVGAPSQYTADGMVKTYAWEKHFYLVTTAGKLIAVSSICTHKGCMVDPKDTGFKCPCHGAAYAADGTIPVETKTKVPLDRFSIALNDKGNVIVDSSKILDHTGIDTNPAASVSVTAK